MKKTLISVLVVLLIAVAVLPYVGAYKTEEVFNNWITQVNQTGAYDLAWESYDKGWLQTHAVLKVGFKPGVVFAASDTDETDWYLPLHLTLNHGPVLWLDGVGLGWFSGEFFFDEKHQMWLEHNLEKQGEGRFFVSKIHMNLMAETTLKDRSLPFSLTTSSGETVQVSAYTGEGTISRSGKLEYSGKLPSFTAAGGDFAEVSAADVLFRLQSDFGARVGQYVTPGYGEFSVKKILIKGQEEWTFDAADLSLVSDMQINSEKTLADVKIKMAFADLNIMGENISNARLDLGFSNISVVFLDQYLAMIQETYEGNSEANSMLAMQTMNMAAEHLLPGGPKIDVSSLAFTTREGSLEFNGHLAVAPEAAQHANNPFALIPHVSVDASLLVDKPLAFRLVRRSTMNELDAAQFEGGGQMTDAEKEALADNQTHMKLDMLTLQGMLVDKGERYSSEFHFKNGQAELNGQPVPLPF
ncbi:MAG: YdgA family protein [Cellvibrionaceae bacterium]|nr:YdgA family protein [Cellvibrionaceae bacterium]